MKKSTWVFIAVLAVIIAGGLAYRRFTQELDSRGATRLMRALEENDTEKAEIFLDETNTHKARNLKSSRQMRNRKLANFL